MNEEKEIPQEPLATTFEEISIGSIFNFLDEPYTKVSNLRAYNMLRKFDWLFPGSTEINIQD